MTLLSTTNTIVMAISTNSVNVKLIGLICSYSLVLHSALITCVYIVGWLFNFSVTNFSFVTI